MGGSSKTEVIIKDGDISGLDSDEIISEYERMTFFDRDITKEGLLRIAVWKSGMSTVFLLVFHHLLADGRGALSLMQELAECYVNGIEPVYAEENLISSKSDMPEDSQLNFVSRLLVKRANKQWAKEGHTLSYSFDVYVSNLLCEHGHGQCHEHC